jgi:hypothetical protein
MECLLTCASWRRGGTRHRSTESLRCQSAMVGIGQPIWQWPDITWMPFLTRPSKASNLNCLRVRMFNIKDMDGIKFMRKLLTIFLLQPQRSSSTDICWVGHLGHGTRKMMLKLTCVTAVRGSVRVVSIRYILLSVYLCTGVCRFVKACAVIFEIIHDKSFGKQPITRKNNMASLTP